MFSRAICRVRWGYNRQTPFVLKIKSFGANTCESTKSKSKQTIRGRSGSIRTQYPKHQTSAHTGEQDTSVPTVRATARSAPRGYHRPERRAIAAQAVLCPRTFAIETPLPAALRRPLTVHHPRPYRVALLLVVRKPGTPNR